MPTATTTPPPALVLSFTTNPAVVPAGEALTVSIIQTGSTLSFSPATQTFVQSPPDELIPVTNFGGPNHANVYTAIVPGVGLPAFTGGYLIYVHGPGGALVSAEPIPVNAQPVNVAPGTSLAIIVKP